MIVGCFEFSTFIEKNDFRGNDYIFLENTNFDKLWNYVLDNSNFWQGKNILNVGRKGKTRIIKVGDHIGTLEISTNFYLEIYPKIYRDKKDFISYDSAKKSMLNMLKYSGEMLAQFKSLDTSLDASSKVPLNEWFLSNFLDECEVLLSDGLLRSYQKLNIEVNSLKGRLDFNKFLLKRLKGDLKFPVISQSFEYNNDVNKYILLAIFKVLEKTKSLMSIKRAQELIAQFELHGITLPNTKLDFDTHYNQLLSVKYKSIVFGANLILSNQGLSIYYGKSSSFVLLLKTEKLYEKYIRKVILKFASSSYKVIEQERKWYLIDDYNGRQDFRIIPDVVMYPKSDFFELPIIILDAKWKKLDFYMNRVSGINKSDLYQLYSYGTKYSNKSENGIPKLVLMYPVYMFTGVKYRTMLMDDEDKGQMYLYLVAFDISKMKNEDIKNEVKDFLEFVEKTVVS